MARIAYNVEQLKNISRHGRRESLISLSGDAKNHLESIGVYGALEHAKAWDVEPSGDYASLNLDALRSWIVSIETHDNDAIEVLLSFVVSIAKYHPDIKPDKPKLASVSSIVPPVPYSVKRKPEPLDEKHVDDEPIVDKLPSGLAEDSGEDSDE
jgi:hypothetical protein